MTLSYVSRDISVCGLRARALQSCLIRMKTNQLDISGGWQFSGKVVQRVYSPEELRKKAAEAEKFAALLRLNQPLHHRRGSKTKIHHRRREIKRLEAWEPTMVAKRDTQILIPAGDTSQSVKQANFWFKGMTGNLTFQIIAYFCAFLECVTSGFIAQK